MSPDEVFDIQAGLEVYGTDGEKIGKVVRVFPDIPNGGPATDTVAPEMRDRRDPATPAATAGVATVGSKTQGMIDSRYFQVDRGGILGLAAKHLYMPFSAVCDVVPGRCLSVSCSKDECAEQYSEKPAFLDENRPTML